MSPDEDVPGPRHREPDDEQTSTPGLAHWLPGVSADEDRAVAAARHQAPGLRAAQVTWNVIGLVCALGVIILVGVAGAEDDPAWLLWGLGLMMAGCAVGILRTLVVLLRARRGLRRDLEPTRRETFLLLMSVRTRHGPRWGVPWSTIRLLDPQTHQDMFVSRTIGELLEEVAASTVSFHGRLRPGGTGVVVTESGETLVLGEPLRVPWLQGRTWKEFRSRGAGRPTER